MIDVFKKGHAWLRTRSVLNFTSHIFHQIKEKEFNKTPNMRKAPMRTSKFFRTSPKERKILKKKEDAKERMAWFDDDNVYGFGFDDWFAASVQCWLVFLLYLRMLDLNGSCLFMN